MPSEPSAPPLEVPGRATTGPFRFRAGAPRRWRLQVAWLAGTASAAFGTAARADPPAIVTLEYEVSPEDAGCPEAEEFRANVEHQLGYDPFRPEADRRVAVQISRRKHHFEGRTRWTDASGRWAGERHLASRHPSCTEIAANLAFSVAVQVQLLASLEPAEAEPAEPSPPPPPVIVAPPPPAPPPPEALPTLESRSDLATQPSPLTGSRVVWRVGLGPAVAFRVAPQATSLGRLFVSGQTSWFSLELALEGIWPVTERSDSGGGFSFDRFAAATAACAYRRWLGACVTTAVGFIEARGFGVDAPASPKGPFGQVGARVVATRDFGSRFFGALRADGLVMLSPWTVRLNEVTVWMTPRVGASVGLDVGARFF